VRQDRGACLDAGVVDHDVQPAEGFDRLVNQLLHLFDLADVGLYRHDPVSHSLDLLSFLIGDVLTYHVVNTHRGASPTQSQHD